jgi:DNA-binding transcriptional LysR family regulator
MAKFDALDWDDLRYFLHAVKARTLAGAARAMGVEHTTIGRRLADRTVQATVVLRGREMTDILAAALGGAGLAVLPCLMGDEEPALQRLTPAVVATRELWLVFVPEVRQLASVKAVMRFVVDVMRDNAERIGGSAAHGRRPALG